MVNNEKKIVVEEEKMKVAKEKVIIK